MIRYDPNSFVQSLMGGMQTGIQLGQNADAQRFARERAAVQDQQTAFGNQMALDSQAMRRAQIEQEAADRAERVAEKERTRMATEQGVKFLMADDETFTSNLPQIAEVLKDAPAGLQNSVVNRRAALRERETRLGQFESLKAQGAKFDENNVKYFEDYGIIVPKDLKVKSLREQDDINDAQEREALIVNAVRQGTLAWEELPTFSKIKNTTLLHSILTQRGAVLAAQQKALAEQQAAAQKQQQAQTHQAHIGQLIQKKRAGVALTPQEEGMLVTTPGVSEYETKQPQAMSPFAFADDQTKLLDTEIGRIEQELLNQGVATKDKGAFLLDKDKVNEGDGKNMVFEDDPPTPEYTRRQELLAQRDKLLKHREALGMAQIQKSIGPVIQQLTAQLGRKPTSAEVRAALGAPPSSQSTQGQMQP